MHLRFNFNANDMANAAFDESLSNVPAVTGGHEDELKVCDPCRTARSQDSSESPRCQHLQTGFSIFETQSASFTVTGEVKCAAVIAQGIRQGGSCGEIKVKAD